MTGEPWRNLGISRATYFRRKAAGKLEAPKLVVNNLAQDVRPKKYPLRLQELAKVKRPLSVPKTLAPAPLPDWIPKTYARKMAQDQGRAYSNNMLTWSATTLGGPGGFGLGIFNGSPYYFPGFQVLAELSLIPEFYLISSVIAEEATRKWLKILSTGPDNKADKVKELTDCFEAFKLKELCNTLVMHDGLYGRAHLLVETAGAEFDDEELLTDIGDGTPGNKWTQLKIRQGSIRNLKVIEPMWNYPLTYNASRPDKPDFYDPPLWLMMAQSVHRSRLLLFVGRPLSNMLQPQFQWAGLSRTQMASPSVFNWLETRQAVNSLINNFSVFQLLTDLESTLAPGGNEDLYDRIQIFNDLRNNQNLMVLNRETEELHNISVPLGTLDALQAQAQEHQASISRIPLVKLLGISPHGLNASSEGEIRVFYDHIKSFQESFLRPNLTKVFRFLQIHLWGAVDPELSFEFQSLWDQDEVQAATIRQIEASTAETLINAGVLAPEEERRVIAEDPNSPYPGLDTESLPMMSEAETGAMLAPGDPYNAEEDSGNAAPQQRGPSPDLSKTVEHAGTRSANLGIPRIRRKRQEGDV
jgi:uncharacterized protein